MTERRLAPTLALAAGLLALALSGCQGDASEAGTSSAATTAATASADEVEETSAAPTPATTDPADEVRQTSAAPVEANFDPKIEVTEGSKALELTDGAGLQVLLTTHYPVADVTGVEPQIADDFAQAVAENHLSRVDSRLQQFSDLTLAECGGERLEQEGQGTCEREAELTVEHAGVFADYGTVATRSGFILGSRDRNPQVHSVTMDLKTGETAAVEDFLDLADPEAQDRATTALQAAEAWAFCEQSTADETPTGYLENAEAFSPTDDGLLLLWAPDPTAPAQCQVDHIVVPWTAPEPAEADPEPTDETAGPSNGPATAEGINGTWCPTPESPATEGCVTVDLPNATYDDGSTVPLTDVGEADGGFAFAMPGAPFGTYVPAGVALEIPDYYPGADLPDQDRIWNGQTGTMLTRQ